MTHALYPDVVGGHAIFCHELSMRQADLGHRTEVLTTRRGHRPERELVRKGYEITRLDSIWMPWDSLGMQNPVIPSLYSVVRRENCDLVDAHSPLFWTTALAVKAANDENRPVITTVHGLMAFRDWLRNLFQRAYLLSIGAWAMKNSSKVVCLTSSDATEVAGLGIRRRNIEVIPVAVDPGMLTPSEEKQDTIVWIGRLVPEKGLEILLRAAAKAREKRHIQLVIAGDGPERNHLLNLASTLKLSGSVDFRPHADRSEVCNLLRNSGIFVLPSFKEGLPLALLEAMASGNAVLASDLPSLRETLGDAGLYFQRGDSAALSEALLKVLDDRDLMRRMGLRAREIVNERFIWDAVLPRLEELYAEVVH